MQYIQSLSPLPSQYSERILCLYTNITNHIQIDRLKNLPNCYFERVVFHEQRLLFEAVLDAQLQMYTCMSGDEIILDRINCNYLRGNEEQIFFELVNQ